MLYKDNLDNSRGIIAPVESVQIEPAERPDERILKAIIVSTIISVAVSVICFVCFKNKI